MKAKEKSLTFIKNQIILEIPFFQRGYVWKEDNWIDLWDELTSNKKDCFLGSIILKDNGEDGEDFHRKLVIDGQQRITTLSIVIRALNDAYNKIDKRTGISSEFKEFLFYTKKIRTENGSQDQDYPKLEPSKNDKNMFLDVIKGSFENKYIDDSNKHPIFLCYSFFREKMESAELATLQNIEKKLTLDDRKIIVKIDLDKGENEQVIFDTINSAGIKLTSADIIKNALYQKINVDNPNEVFKFYEETWYTHFEVADKIKSWLEERVTGRIKRTSIDMFLQAFAIIKGFYTPQKDVLQDLPDKYKEKLAKINVDETKEMINSLCEYADIYYDNFVGFNSTTGLKYDDNIVRLLHILHEMEVSTFDAYVLKLLKDYSENEEELTIELKKLESYIMRNYIINNTTNIKNYNKDSMLLIEGTSKIDEWLIKSDISDNEVEKGIKCIKYNDKAKLILFWILLHRWSCENSDMKKACITYNFELEHVMPQKWEDNWGLDVLPVLDEKGKKVKDDTQATEIRAAKIYELGNMTLLKSKLNKTLSNRKFDEKVNGCIIRGKKKDGMRDLCDFSITKEITDLSAWNENSITSRTGKLFKEIIDIWPTVIKKDA